MGVSYAFTVRTSYWIDSWGYERTIRHEADCERRDTGRWSHDEGENVLRLDSDVTDENDRKSSQWWVLSVHKCERSNCILVLRHVALASRNLPIRFTGSIAMGAATEPAGSKGSPNS